MVFKRESNWSVTTGSDDAEGLTVGAIRARGGVGITDVLRVDNGVGEGRAVERGRDVLSATAPTGVSNGITLWEVGGVCQTRGVGLAGIPGNREISTKNSDCMIRLSTTLTNAVNTNGAIDFIRCQEDLSFIQIVHTLLEHPEQQSARSTCLDMRYKKHQIS